MRCVYHGWKFDIDGNTVDMPAEPENSRFKNALKIKAYPCRERNGVVWAYMGPDRNPLPPLPDHEWNVMDAGDVHVSFRIQECNWLQALEGDIDSAHAAILHGRTDGEGRAKRILGYRDMRPTFEVQRLPHGLSIAAKRKFKEGQVYWRVNQFVLPFYTMAPPQSNFPELSGHAWVPMDDEHTLVIMFSYVPGAALYEKTKKLFENGYNGRETGHASNVGLIRDDHPARPYAGFWTKYNRQNDYQFDYDGQKQTWFSGLPGLWVQDAACQSGIEAISDRTQENLGVSDSGIVGARRLLLDSVKAYHNSGVLPPTVTDPKASMVRAVSLQLDENDTWSSPHAREHMRAEIGKGFGYTP